ncbi:DUF4249 family protein [Alkalitalea saponilacus]|uniref:DUF4249 domain-containing protein n=1 Tax=Alkalitalea saponilacus TaxID=889453 RepID=A0A1T5AX17_9BACT|nr:DUF4249 family protein [Alkalitalea saponilacus]ASB48572.1 hypothetical protein CDL62_05170 [Alkalitalea saponilacus]SKB39359.1 protein of unknown function [Alkalitalea saponilacus]
MTKYISVFWLLFLVLLSCAKVIDFPPVDFEKEATMNAFVIAGEPILVHLSSSDYIEGGELHPITDAEILIYSNGELIDHDIYSESGWYYSEIIASEGKSYCIRAALTQGDTLIANQTVPVNPGIIAINHINEAGVDEEGVAYPSVKVTLENKLERTHYYEIILKYREREEVQIPEIIFIDDPLLLRTGLPLLLFTDEGVTGEVYTVSINYTTGSVSGSVDGGEKMQLYPLTVELRAVTEEYYSYREYYYLNMQSQRELEPGQMNYPVPLYSNVNNGYGVVVAFSSVVSDVIDPNE